MDNLDKYIADRKKKFSPDPGTSGPKLTTKKSAISRIENYAEDIRFSTIKRFTEAVSKRIELIIA
jgi:hypothetical protein